MMKGRPKILSKYGLELCLIALALAVFGQTVSFSFINYDDPSYVIKNRHIALTGENIGWAFTSGDLSNYHPLTWISYMVDHALFGMHAGGYHAVNVMLHMLSTLILYAALRRMTKNGAAAFLTAALFAVHPLRAESVAWVSERKDVLSVFFAVSTLWAYVRYTERPSIGRYLPVAGLFALCLLSKSMLVTLPAVLLLLDYWPLGRLDGGVKRAARLALEKAPLLALSLAAGIIALFLRTNPTIEAASRAVNVPVVYGEYLLKLMWPAHLMVRYPIVKYDVASAQFIGSAAALLGISIIVVLLRRSRPYLLMGWLWFVGTLLPVTGFVQVGTIRASDRYTYFPSIGFFIAVVWLVASLLEKKRVPAGVLKAVSAAALVAVAAAAWAQTTLWRNTETLFLHALAISPDDAVSLYNLGCEYIAQNRNEDAERLLARAVKLDSRDPGNWTNLGLAKGRLGKREDELSCYMKAIELKPDHFNATLNAGDALLNLKRFAEAESYFLKAIKLNSESPEALFGLGYACAAQDRYAEALPHLQKAVRLKPHFVDATLLMAAAYQKLNRPDEAEKAAREVLRMQPGHGGALSILKSLGVATDK